MGLLDSSEFNTDIEVNDVSVRIGDENDVFPSNRFLDEPVDISIGKESSIVDEIEEMLDTPSERSTSPSSTEPTETFNRIVQEIKKINQKQEMPCPSKEADRLCKIYRFERWGEILYMGVQDKYWRAIPSESKSNEILRPLVKRKYRTSQGIREVFADIYCNAIQKPRYDNSSIKGVYIGFPDLALDVRSGKTQEHSLSHGLTFLLGIKYKNLSRNERNQTVIDFIKDLCGGDNDMMLRLRDVLCLSLLNIPLFKIFFLVGGEGGGRVVLFQLLESVLGQDNVAYLSFVDMTRNYRLFHTVDKACNISFEEGDQVISNIDTLKKFAQGAGVNTDRKYGEALDFIPRTKIYCGGAHLPNVAHGRLEGLTNELEIVRLSPTCLLNFQQRHELFQGVPFFASWLVRGAIELAERNFQIQTAAGCTIADYNAQYDDFLTRHVVSSPDTQVHSSEISDLYCREQGISTLSARERTQLQGRVQQNFGVELKKSIRKNGKVSSGYRGITIENEEEENDDE